LPTYSLHIHDRRYSVPTLRLAVLDGPERAIAAARAALLENDDHLGVEVFDAEGAQIASLGRELVLADAERPQT